MLKKISLAFITSQLCILNHFCHITPALSDDFRYLFIHFLSLCKLNVWHFSFLSFVHQAIMSLCRVAACNMTPDAQPFEKHCDIWTKGFEEVHEVKREANLHINVSLR